MKKTLLITVVALMVNISLFARIDKENKSSDNKKAASTTVVQAMLSGNIIDQTTGEALTGVKVILEGTDKVSYTDFDGYFSFKTVTPGKYNLKVDYISYKGTSIEKVKISNGANSLKIELKPVNK